MSCISNSAQLPRKWSVLEVCIISDWNSWNQFEETKENAAVRLAVLKTCNKQYPSITVKAHVSSGRDTELHRKLLQFSLKSLICNTVSFWEDLSIEVVSRARYPKALLEGGHDCRLAVCRLWHLKAVSRLMSPHENLMKKVFPKRCRLREQRKTLISHITAGKGKLKGARKPHWHSE